MELEGLFSGTRWEILTQLSQGKYSPMELADVLGTTSANISQQLRLLELAGLVKSERTRQSDKKKPRVMYFLADNYTYLILTSTNYAQKKLLPATDYVTYFIKSLFVPNEEYHKYIGLFYWAVSEHITKIDYIAVDNTSDELKMVVVCDKKTSDVLSKKIQKSDYGSRGFKFETLSKKDFENKRSKTGLFTLYDPNGLDNKNEVNI